MAKKIPGLCFQSEETREPGLLASAFSDDFWSDQRKKHSEEDNAKLQILCRHYGIQSSPSMFYELALALARDIYPAPKKRGRKSKWTNLNQGALVVEVERLVIPDDPAHGVEWACNQLARREPWISFLETKEGGTHGPDPAEALRQIYFHFRSNRWAEISRSAFARYEREGARTEWERKVSDFVRNPYPK